MTERSQTTTTKPWDDGDKATLLEWWERWLVQEKKPESVNLSAAHFERMLEGAVYEIQRTN
jgi:hypothetical protein